MRPLGPQAGTTGTPPPVPGPRGRLGATDGFEDRLALVFVALALAMPGRGVGVDREVDGRARS